MGSKSASAAPVEGTRRPAVSELVADLSQAQDAAAAAERLAEHAARVSPGAAVRVYLLGPGDRCATCARAKECTTRDRCFHLAAERGSFSQPAGHADRIPRVGTPWGEALGAPSVERDVVPAELSAPASSSVGSAA